MIILTNARCCRTIRLQPTPRGGRKNWLLTVMFGRRPPLGAAEAGREADAYSRAASRRGCTRLRRQPRAAELRVRHLSDMDNRKEDKS